MGLSKANQTSFKKGLTPWNKGMDASDAAKLIRSQKSCSRCGKKFTMNAFAQKYCSPRCATWNKRCIFCNKDFAAWPPKTKYCSSHCSGKHLSELRKGKNNPAYRNGFSVAGKRTYTGIHLRACAKYRKAFYERVDYPYCEVCGVNAMGTPKFEVHHIYFASLWPKHPYLHDFRNLIHICIRCHNDFHKMRLQDVFEKLEKERGLKELFSKNKDSPKKEVSV